MRLGLYGGTFDPVHFGHLLLAETCREVARLDEVWFIPTGTPPHKPGVEIAPAKSRREMLELAIAGLPQFQVSRLEIDRPGPHYTVDTLRLVREQRPEDELFLLIGKDSLFDLPTWRDPRAISELANIVAVNRTSRSWDKDFEDARFKQFGRPEPVNPYLFSADVEITGHPGLVFEVDFVTMPQMDISATDLRQRVAAERSIRFQTPRAVEQYIRAHRLYRTPVTAENAVPPKAAH
ncbi:Nicotinate-nucleotide adenylyltransferase [Caulifigura coniformis]|uniref:Probable nicotinate-nucleotide adenylyltransferase n=1 Tax=Caulifigura coniformis TaxID=2527983 RepID=A0A517SHJ2_9PLAN|nr:nicotinate-nucleotide adenylyltransferase [Caulifigura coniformis]QDT55594.1 Nicotinate-nucleotide adenylyltransferase [Caulifigura coniformis]